MIDMYMIDKRINNIKEHGDCSEDIRDLAMLLYVKKHFCEKDNDDHGDHLTQKMAEEWVDNMRGDDPAVAYGGKWTAEQIKPIATKYGVPTEGERFWTFYAVMNAMYSDYYAVAKKYNTLNPDFFADLAMAFINDRDAVKNKATVYYECIASD